MSDENVTPIRPPDKTRPYQLDMSYESSWSLLDDIETAALEKEEQDLKEKLRTAIRAARDIDDRTDRLVRKTNVLAEVLAERRWEITKANFEINPSHIALLEWMSFGYRQEWPSYVPPAKDAMDVLKWEKPNDDYSNAQHEEVQQIIDELPLAVRELINVFKEPVRLGG